PALGELKPMLGPLSLLYFAVVSRSAVSYGFMTFLPLQLARGGHPIQTGGWVVSLYLLAGALGAVVGGWLADRWGGRRVVLLSFIAATPLYGAFLFLPERAGILSL